MILIIKVIEPEQGEQLIFLFLLIFFSITFCSNDNIDEIESLSLEDIETRVMILNDKIQDNMWFV
jgi:hypothetical protein